MSNTQRFAGRVDSYERYRQRYDAAAILPLLRKWCGLAPEWLIADIGAGTGMLAEVFLANGNRVIAIEPNDEMRAACARLSGASTPLDVLNGTAEATGLGERSVEMVAAGRAFHWFDVPHSLAEFRRILKPNGWLALVSLGRMKDDSAQSAAFERLLMEHGTDYRYVRDGYRVHEKLEQIFTRDLHKAEIHGVQELDWQSFRGQTMSLSVAPAPDDARFAAFDQSLHALFDTYAVAGILSVATTCWVAAGRISTQ